MRVLGFLKHCLFHLTALSVLSISFVAASDAIGESHRFSVRFGREIPAEDSYSGKVNYVLDVVDEVQKSSAELALDRPMEPIAETTLSFHTCGGDKVVAEARWNGRPDASTVLFIIDAIECSVVDTIQCRDPIFSPSKRYWVYEKFMRSRAPLWVSTSVILCYDLDKSPEENRMGPPPRFPSDSEVGWAVYPPPFVAAQAYFLPDQQQTRPEGWYALVSPFLWAEDADKVYFLCQEKGHPTALVSVDLSKGPKQPLSGHAVLTSETAKIRPFTSGPNDPDRREHWVPAIVAGELSWRDKTHIKIHTHSVYNSRAPDEFIVEIPHGDHAE
jgi:hypothetical protein